MRRAIPGLTTSMAAVLLLAGCGEANPSPGDRARAGGGTSGNVNGSGGSTGAAIDTSACTPCHGDPARNAAPPQPVATANTQAVGAHQKHVAGGAIRGPVACEECHVVPATVNAAGHIDGARADVRFGTAPSARLAAALGATPAYDPATGTCSNVYCHGARTAGGAAKSPVWTRTDGSQEQCGSCHGFPPPAPHPAVAPDARACAGCHAATVRDDGTIDLAGAKHVDGKVDFSAGAGGCTSCHGSAANPAPPGGTKGETATTSRAVGAHQAHLTKTNFRSAAVSCTECHAVPTSTSHSNGTVDLSWGTLARTGGTSPAFNGTSCSATYCHGATLGAGGSATSPGWTGTFGATGSTLECTSCHGAPPPAPHPANTACGGCHTGYTSSTVNASTHINGTLDVAGLSCTSCHGSAANPAPPVGTKGETATTSRAVGAHQAHLTKTNFRSAAVSCTECHALPTSTSHSNGTVDLSWGTLARTGGTSPAFNGTSCAATYCHGATLGAGGSATSPGWTGTFGATGSTLACASCHGNPPGTGRHQRSEHLQAGCAACHGAGYGAGSLHIDGAKSVGGTGSLINTWTRPSCSPSCHGTESW